MTTTEAMRVALEQTQRINRLQAELEAARTERTRALAIIGPALAIAGAEPETLTLAGAVEAADLTASNE